MNSSPAVTPSSDGATVTPAPPDFGYGPRPVEELEDAPTIEFAPGLRRPISLGTPPPPPTHFFEARLGRLEPRPGSRRVRVLVPVVAAGLVVAAIGVGLTLRGENAGPQPNAPVARVSSATTGASTTTATLSDSAVPSPSAEPTPQASSSSQQVVVQPQPNTPTTTQSTPPPGPPPPTLTGPGSVPFGQSVFLNANGFACGAGAQLTVTISHGGSEYAVFDGASATDAQGSATIRIIVQEVEGVPGQVAINAGPPNYVALAPGEWTVRVANPEQAGCTGTASASSSVTVV